MTAAALPRMRGDLRRKRLEQDGRVVFVVTDPVSGKYFRFGEMEVWIMDRLDGTRTYERVSAELKAESGKRAPPATIEGFYEKLKDLGLAERTSSEKSVLLMEMLRGDRKARLKPTHNTVFRMRFSWGDPDRLFNRVVGHLSFFWTRGFVVASAIVFALYGVILAMNWPLFVTGFRSLYQPSTWTPGFIASLYMTGVVVFVIHELGHGLTCKHFGGEVHEMGMMLLYFSPAFYCNVNDAWTFEKRSHRLWTTFAGAWIQLWIAMLAAVIWAITEPESDVNRIAFIATLLAGGMSIVMNYNPLLPLDGYYALVDWVGITNLRARAMELVGSEAKRRILRLSGTAPTATPRERRILLVYGVLAAAYTGFVLWAFAHWAGSLAVRKLGGWGWVLIAYGAWRFTRKLRSRLVRVARAWAAERKGGGRRRPVAAWTGAGAALLLVGALGLPWTVRVHGTGIVEAGSRGWVRAGEAGWVDDVAAAEGQKVAAGQVLIRLRNPDMEVEAARAAAAVRALEREAAAARSRGDAAASSAAETGLAAARREDSAWEQRLARLIVRAPYAGTIATPHPEQLRGARMTAGDSLLELWPEGGSRVRVTVSQRDAGDLAAGDPVRVRFPGRADVIWHTRLASLAPAARADSVDMLAPLGTAPATGVRAGAIGEAHIDVRRTTIAGAVRRAMRRLIRTELFL